MEENLGIEMVSCSQILISSGLGIVFLAVLVPIKWRWKFLSYDMWKARRIEEIGSLLKDQYKEEKAEFEKTKKALKMLLILLLIGTSLQIMGVLLQ